MHVSDAFVDFLASWEGERLEAYQVSGEHFWTIGVGHTGSVNGVPVHKGMKISKATSRALLKHDLLTSEAAVNRLVPLRWRRRRRRFETFVSLAFNMGPEILTASPPLTSVGEGLKGKVTRTTIAHMAFAIQLYNKGGSPLRVMEGLVKRRSAESQLFVTGRYVHNT
jgi:lysozyme